MSLLVAEWSRNHEMGCWLLLTPNGSRRTYFIAKKIQLTLETETSLNKLASIILDFSRFVLRKLNFKVFFFSIDLIIKIKIKITKSEFPRFGSRETRWRLWPGFVMPALQPEQQPMTHWTGLRLTWVSPGQLIVEQYWLIYEVKFANRGNYMNEKFPASTAIRMEGLFYNSIVCNASFATCLFCHLSSRSHKL